MSASEDFMVYDYRIMLLVYFQLKSQFFIAPKYIVLMKQSDQKQQFNQFTLFIYFLRK